MADRQKRQLDIHQIRSSKHIGDNERSTIERKDNLLNILQKVTAEVVSC